MGIFEKSEAVNATIMKMLFDLIVDTGYTRRLYRKRRDMFTWLAQRLDPMVLESRWDSQGDLALM